MRAEENHRIRPFLRWAGSKKKLLPTLAGFWQDRFSRYVEPFAGSASLFFDLAPSKAILGDLNRELIITYEAVCDSPAHVFRNVMRIPAGRSSYYHLRGSDPERLSRYQRAARFIFLNRFCFNGLYRTNRSGEFNVPYAPQRTGQLPSLEHLRECSVLLRRSELVCADFERTLSKCKLGDFVYMDPPFSVSARRTFAEYGAEVFGGGDLDRLSSALRELDRKRVQFLVSYADCTEGRALASDWTVRRCKTRRNIAGFTASRRTDTELLIYNKPAVPSRRVK